MKRKCYVCRKPIKGKSLFCKKCENKPIPPGPILKIYDKI